MAGRSSPPNSHSPVAESTVQGAVGSGQQAIAIRGRPKEGAWIDNNWFHHSSHDGAILQTGGEDNACLKQPLREERTIEL